MFLLVDNSDPPSLVEQSQEGHGSSCYTLLAVVPSSVKSLMSYACQLTSCSMGISYYAPCSCFYDLTFPMFFSFVTPTSYFLLLTFLHSYVPTFPGPLQSPFYPGCFLIEPWDSLSDYVHPGIACLTFQSSDWAGASWGSLSGFVISHLLLGVHSSMTLVKLIMIGYCCDCLGG